MVRWLVAVALVVGCHGDPEQPAAPPAPLAPVELVPRLPVSVDGVQALAALDKSIEKHRGDHTVILLLLARASIRGQLDDYVDALAESARWIDQAPSDAEAWKARVQALSRVHRFAAAREAITRVKALSTDPGDWEDAIATLDEATGQHAAAAAYREHAANEWPSPSTLTMWAASLATEDRFDAAIAIIPKAAARVRDNPATLFSWLLFQWGRIYELAGKPAAARQFYTEGLARLPDSLETIVHLVETTRATGGSGSELVAAALARNRHPALLALAGKLPEARAEWERYVAALPEAFADHAARFYLGPGADPKRALALARLDRANRDTDDARALVVEAALAANDASFACEVAPSLVAARRTYQFLAWRAFGTCGRHGDADALAARLGIR